MADWHYIGHYGQLGPLTREQIEELIEGGVIARDTYVWRVGMTTWIHAEKVPELATVFRANGMQEPPPMPSASSMTGHQVATPPVPGNPFGRVEPPFPQPTVGQMPSFHITKSDKSRTVGGIIQLLIPGVGRMYMGYWAVGVLQLVLSMCFVGWVWSVIDGIIILTGGVRIDGYGRELNE